MGMQNQSARPIKKQLEVLFFALYYLSGTCYFIFNVMLSKVFVMRLLQFQGAT